MKIISKLKKTSKQKNIIIPIEGTIIRVPLVYTVRSPTKVLK